MRKSLVLLFCLVLLGCSYEPPKCNPRYVVEKYPSPHSDLYNVYYIGKDCIYTPQSQPLFLDDATKLMNTLNKDTEGVR